MSTGNNEIFVEDVVEVEGRYALVVRSWTMQEEEQSHKYRSETLAPGFVEVRDALGERMVIEETALILKDRGFMPGDIVRRSNIRPNDPTGAQTGSRLSGAGQAGIIKSTSKWVKLRRALSTEMAVRDNEWIPVEEVIGADVLMNGDHVIFEDWVGIVEDCFQRATVETVSGGNLLMFDASSTFGGLSVGSRTNDLAPPEVNVNWLPGNHPTRVIALDTMVVAVNWLCVSQLLPASKQDQPRPPRYWNGPQIATLTVVRSTASHIHALGDKVIFRDPATDPFPPTLGASHYIMAVTLTKTTVEVLFQDGTIVKDDSTRFQHCQDLDEDVDVFPGELGMCNARTPAEVAVAQTMDFAKRTILVRWAKSGETELVSGLEFDPNGPPPQIYGVGRHDRVLIASGSTGEEGPVAAILGESEVRTGTFPVGSALRSMMHVNAKSLEPTMDRLLPPTQAALAIDWYGEVVDLLLDGRVQVRFPDGKEEAFALDRIYRLDDGLDLDDPMDDDHDHEMMSGDEMSEGNWDYEAEQDLSGAEDVEGEEEEGIEMSWESSVEGDRRTPSENGWASEGDDEEEVASAEVLEAGVIEAAVEEEDSESFQRFVILDEAPTDHHYYNEPILTPSRGFTSRMQKEYQALRSLPQNILVRAYSNRSDLIRCLIIGPAGTPFVEAPFLFDVFLSPATFPAEPPKVFFHSWCGGTRISPNLYAEGKVCLSLLGTWPGQSVSESWSSARSSILQIFVSIGSLVIVEEPYYTEPGFEKNATSGAASGLYNERTYVLSRAFVKRATKYPPMGFESEIKYYYGEKGLLKQVVNYAKLLLEESDTFHESAESTAAGQEKKESAIWKGQKILTEGACLSLRRTLKELESTVP